MQPSGTNLTPVGVISFRTSSELCGFQNTSESSTQAYQVFYLYGDSKFFLFVFRGFTELDKGI